MHASLTRIFFSRSKVVGWDSSLIIGVIWKLECLKMILYTVAILWCICGNFISFPTSAQPIGISGLDFNWQNAEEPQSRLPRRAEPDNDQIMIFEDDELPEKTLDGSLDPYDESNYNEQEKDCFAKRKFFVNGKCYSLAAQGPCTVNETLVLEKPKDDETSLLKPVCKKKRCMNKGEIWWFDTQRCEVKNKIQEEKCQGTGKGIIANPYGESIYACIDNYGEMEGRNQCFEYYQRGPCALDEVVTYDVTLGFAVCTKDKCYQDNMKNRNNRQTCNSSSMRGQRGKAPKKQIYAPLDGSGSCYLLGSSELCSIISQQSRYVIDKYAHVPRCSNSEDLQLNIIDPPTQCRVGDDKQCKDPVVVKQEDRLAHLGNLKNQRLKRSGK